MAKVKCYFDKSQFVPIVSAPGFYAYPIEVDENVLRQCESLFELFDWLKVSQATAAYPRDAQRLADEFADQLSAIMKVQKRKPKNVSTDEE